MRKRKSEARVNELSAEQQRTLDEWLFEKKQSYAAILRRAQAELGFKGSESSLRRYYARRDKERTLTEFKSLRDEVAAVRNAPEDAASLRTAAMKLLGAFLFEQVKHAPDKVKEWAAVADLLVRNDYNEIVRAAKSGPVIALIFRTSGSVKSASFRFAPPDSCRYGNKIPSSSGS
jgi:Protein of unknown function (DUF3486)